MIIRLTGKESKELEYHFETDSSNIIILNGYLYELTDDEVVKFYSGEYMKEHLKSVENGCSISDEFDLGLYIVNAPYYLENYLLEIE